MPLPYYAADCQPLLILLGSYDSPFSLFALFAMPCQRCLRGWLACCHTPPDTVDAAMPL